MAITSLPRNLCWTSWALPTSLTTHHSRFNGVCSKYSTPTGLSNVSIYRVTLSIVIGQSHHYAPQAAVVLCPAHCCSVGFVRLSSAGIRDMPYTDPFMILYTQSHMLPLLTSMFLSLQMVQAIQVLRFHLLELEKVSISINYNWNTFGVGNRSMFYRRARLGSRYRIDSGQTTLGPVSAPPVLNFENYFEFVRSDQVFAGREWERAFAFQVLFVLSLISHFGVFRCEPVGFLRVSHRQFSPLCRPRIEL